MPTSPAKISHVARLCHRAAEHYGTTFSHVFSRIVRLRALERFSPKESFLWGLADPALPGRELARHVSRSRLAALQRRHNPMSLSYLTEDKATFYAYCTGAGIQVPTFYGVYHRDVGWSRTGGLVRGGENGWQRFFSEDTGADLVIKPSKGVYARGLRVLRRRGDSARDGFLDASLGEDHGEPISLDDLRAALDADPRYDTFVVQDRVTTHPELHRLSGSDAVQTVRAVTFLDDEHRPRLLFACLKVIVGGNMSDNFDFGRSGNLLADIDLESGRLDSVRGVDPSGFGLHDHAEHPATGVVFDRFVLPHWPKVRRLAEEAAVKFHPLRTIGWDIAITPDGPAILEGNVWWDPLHNAHQLVPRYLALFDE
ncbi:MAG: sugar-transfer associated ATP-grasp domain-containing protein [Acidobacteriota bacterium]